MFSGLRGCGLKNSALTFPWAGDAGVEFRPAGVSMRIALKGVYVVIGVGATTKRGERRCSRVWS